MRKKDLIIGLLFVVLVSTLVLIVVGQNNNVQNSKKQLVERFDRTVKNKEPKFKGGRTGGWGEFPTELQSSLGWKFGEAYINASISDYYSENDAIRYFKLNYSENPLSPLIAYGGVKLTNLADEAWMNVTDRSRKDGNAQIVFRKGSVIIRIQGTSTSLTKRFARYLVREIEKRDRGEP
jgi:hypothetical protein